MISINRGQVNKLMIPAGDIDIPAGVLILVFENASTKKKEFCQISDSGNFTDWVELDFTEVPAGADPLLSEVTLRDGDYIATLYSAATYTETMSLLTKIRSERAKV